MSPSSPPLASLHKGSRWCIPSYLDVIEGPWGRSGEFGHDVARSWRAAIDWHAENGLDTIIADIPMSRSDFVYLGWGFHYLLDFADYPYGEELFSADFRKRNIETLSKIYGHGKAMGVRCFAQHFNFMAPRRMALASGWAPRYKSDGAMGGNPPDSLGLLVQNCRWSIPSYQEFMVRCWKETMQALPDLTGFLVTFGEPTFGLFALNADGTGDVMGSTQDQFPARYYADERFVENAVDFVTKFSGVVRDAGRVPMVRAWGMQWARNRMPKTVDYVVKYQLFDCIDAGPDPVVSEWVKAGHRVWAEAEVIGENAGPVLWTSPEYFERVARDVAALGLAGVVTHENSIFEPASLNTPAKHLNLQLMVEAWKGADAGALRKKSVEILEETYAGDAAAVVEALELVAKSVLGFSRVIHRCDEGFSFGWSCSILPVNGGFCSIIMANGTPPEWCRQGMIAFKEYLDFLSINQYEPGCLETWRGARECPIAFMQSAAEAGQRAVEILSGLAARWSDEVEMRDLIACAAMATAQAEEIATTFEALLAYYSAKRCIDPDLQKELAATCVGKFRESRVAKGRIREWAIQLSPEHFSCSYTQERMFSHLKDGYERFSLETAFYEKECQELLDGKTWTMSTIEITWRGIDSLGPLRVTWPMVQEANLPRLGI